MEIVSIIFSTIAVLLSIFVFWYTYFRNGTIKMTKPSVLYFGPDSPGTTTNKIYLKSLIYSTSERGQYIQNMYVKLINKNEIRIFNIWVFGDQTKLDRGSGLFVNRQGHSSNHHFLLNKQAEFKFEIGQHTIEVYAETVNNKEVKIYEQTISFSEPQIQKMNAGMNGLYFDWDPSINQYVSHLETKTNIEFDPFKKMN